MIFSRSAGDTKRPSASLTRSWASWDLTGSAKSYAIGESTVKKGPELRGKFRNTTKLSKRLRNGQEGGTCCRDQQHDSKHPRRTRFLLLAGRHGLRARADHVVQRDDHERRGELPVHPVGHHHVQLPVH